MHLGHLHSLPREAPHDPFFLSPALPFFLWIGSFFCPVILDQTQQARGRSGATTKVKGQVGQSQRTLPYICSSHLSVNSPPPRCRLPTAEPDHQVLPSWVVFLSMRQEIHDPIVYDELQLVEHLWSHKCSN
jgi:hypothetical protein